MSDTELIDPAVLESLPEQPEPPQDGLNRLQKKMLKYFLFGDESGTGSHNLRLKIVYRMIEAGVFTPGISFDETRDRADEWEARNRTNLEVDWCEAGEMKYRRAMKHKEPPRPRDEKGRFISDNRPIATWDNRVNPNPLRRLDDGGDYQPGCSCERCVPHRAKYGIRD